MPAPVPPPTILPPCGGNSGSAFLLQHLHSPQLQSPLWPHCVPRRWSPPEWTSAVALRPSSRLGWDEALSRIWSCNALPPPWAGALRKPYKYALCYLSLYSMACVLPQAVLHLWLHSSFDPGKLDRSNKDEDTHILCQSKMTNNTGWATYGRVLFTWTWRTLISIDIRNLTDVQELVTHILHIPSEHPQSTQE